MGRSSRIGTFGTPEKADRERCERAMEELGIAHMRRMLCNQISGGELQMVLIARALCAEPKLLVLDERNPIWISATSSSFLKRFAAFPAKRDCAASSTRIIPATRCASPTGRSSSHARVRQTSASLGGHHAREIMGRVFKVNVDIVDAQYDGMDYQAITAISLCNT